MGGQILSTGRPAQGQGGMLGGGSKDFEPQGSGLHLGICNQRWMMPTSWAAPFFSGLLGLMVALGLPCLGTSSLSHTQIPTSKTVPENPLLISQSAFKALGENSPEWGGTSRLWNKSRDAMDVPEMG